MAETTNVETKSFDTEVFMEHNDNELTFLDIPWEDVVFKYIMPCLPLQTKFQMRRVSKQWLEMVTLYFSVNKTVNTCRIANKMTVGALSIMTRNNSSLQDLVLRNSKDWLTDPVLMPVLKQNPKLQRLDISNCSFVTNSSLQVLGVNCQNVRVVSLSECHWVSVDGLTVLAMQCVNLESLDLTGCWGVNDEAITLLAVRCKKLQYLSMAKIYGLTDYAMAILAREAISLRHLNIRGCWRLSDDSIGILAEYAKNLKALEARECRDITENSLYKLRNRGVKIDVRPPQPPRGLAGLRHRRPCLNIQI
ncbi:F-box/LRR-repeat protein 15-like [Saccostrea cucullata]|uniref:F-box/LRR-repeat protein 15-like n=1 Tax=Saccostrea cuccullata TaxID=36930 RepID=UPI002ED3DBB1